MASTTSSMLSVDAADPLRPANPHRRSRSFSGMPTIASQHPAGLAAPATGTRAPPRRRDVRPPDADGQASPPSGSSPQLATAAAPYDGTKLPRAATSSPQLAAPTPTSSRSTLTAKFFNSVVDFARRPLSPSPSAPAQAAAAPAAEAEEPPGPPRPPTPPPLPTPEVLAALRPPVFFNVAGETRELHPATGLPYAPEDRNEEFHKIFGSAIPADERLITDFVCAYNIGVLVDGKLWISEHHLCFRGWTSKPTIIIDMWSITHIEKRSFAAVVPNAIEVETADAKHFFGTVFPPRNPKYNLMVKLWCVHVDFQSLARKKPDMSRLRCFCGELAAKGSTDKCDVCIKKEVMRNKNSSVMDFYHLAAPSDDTLSRSPMRGRGSTQGGGYSPSFSGSSRAGSELLEDRDGDGDGDDDDFDNDDCTTDGSEKCDVPAPTEAVDCNCIANPVRTFAEEGFTCVLDMVLPLTLDELWAEWFSCPQSPNFYVRFFSGVRQFRELQLGPWVSSEERDSVVVPIGQISDYSQYDVKLSAVRPGLHRTTQYIVPINAPIGPKQTRSINNDNILAHKRGHFVCQEVHSVSPDVSDAFYNIGRTCFSYVSPTETRVRLHWKVVFTKSSMTKAIVSRITVEQMRSLWESFAKYIAENYRRPGDDSSESSKPRVLDRDGSTATVVQSPVSGTPPRSPMSSPSPLARTDAAAAAAASASPVSDIFSIAAGSAGFAVSIVSATISPVMSHPSRLVPVLLVFLFVMVILNTMTLVMVVRVLDRSEMRFAALLAQRGGAAVSGTLPV
ncbi:hypothetical protein HK105_202485 [Polyrhizophydium stewartii]|uniref:VASt domain-containing protein n=1 Tax=Polyrhizophydium stewartii TaxID=2732419 RepID=A0ABR4NEX0_9FUNG